MTYRVVPGDGLRTRYAEAPSVRFITKGEAWPDVRMAFCSAPLNESHPFHYTRLTFERVLDFHWVEFEIGVLAGNEEDLEFGLIEISDSEVIRTMVERSKFVNETVGHRLGSGVSESDVRHFRIAFDDHGTYDIVCAGCEIAHFDELASAVNDD